MKKKVTIKEFLDTHKAEWTNAMQGVHEDDYMPFMEWMSEYPSSELRREWGIYRDRANDEWVYDESNENWRGDDLCNCCGDRYKWEDTETDLCGDCDAIEF
jgi:hypothetical protein